MWIKKFIIQQFSYSDQQDKPKTKKLSTYYWNLNKSILIKQNLNFYESKFTERNRKTIRSMNPGIKLFCHEYHTKLMLKWKWAKKINSQN